MNFFITLDCGTTNTRISLVKDGEIIGTVKMQSSSDRELYKKELAENIKKILKNNGLCEKDVVRILATGTMASAEIGLCPSEHLKAPVGLSELKKGTIETKIPEISEIPFVFVRGVKTACESLENADMMRGEESEIMGIMTDDYECVYLLMGSHTKIIKTVGGKIADICTLLTGEMASACASETILKHSFDLKNGVLDEKYLKKGCLYCEKSGLSESLFKARILRNIFGATESEAYSFFVGAVLCDEVRHILSSGIKKVVVGGNEHLKNAICILLTGVYGLEVVSLSKKEVDESVSMGLVKIFNHTL